MSSGSTPRYVVVTVNTVEFFLTAAVSATFLVSVLTGHWPEADGLLDHAIAVAELIIVQVGYQTWQLLR